MVAVLWSATAAGNPPVPADFPPDHAIGRHAGYFREAGARLGLDEAVAAREAGRFTTGDGDILNFGIGSQPVWIHFSVVNPAALPLPRRLSLETSWLDRVDVHVRHGRRTVADFHAGDDRAFDLRPVKSRYFAFDHAFAPGISDVYVRVETPDPMVVPIHLLTPEGAHGREKLQDYSYGFLYGFLLALAAYNVALFASLRSARYLLYSVYLLMFMAMNISYTGHGYEWIWPAQLQWQQWGNPILMVLYGISGLLFALRFLDTHIHLPRIHKGILGACAAFAAALAAAVLAGNQVLALLIAFTFVFPFTATMLALGVISVRAGQRYARYFLVASVAGMIGAVSTGLSTWGWIPHSLWTFRAVEIGMIIDATLLALALAQQFRIGQEEKISAEHLAQIDPLTGINNRRAFYDKVSPVWSGSLRHNRNVSIILLDIDRFKQINDAHGHAHGDAVLVATARALAKSVRQEDVVARWGGEEFIVFLPETDIPEAVALAERLRVAIAAIRVRRADGETAYTASFGVARREIRHGTLDSLISAADKYLYQSKDMGRNRVSGDTAPGAA